MVLDLLVNMAFHKPTNAASNNNRVFSNFILLYFSYLCHFHIDQYIYVFHDIQHNDTQLYGIQHSNINDVTLSIRDNQYWEHSA
jgi:hypothetical protein